MPGRIRPAQNVVVGNQDAVADEKAAAITDGRTIGIAKHDPHDRPCGHRASCQIIRILQFVTGNDALERGLGRTVRTIKFSEKFSPLAFFGRAGDFGRRCFPQMRGKCLEVAAQIIGAFLRLGDGLIDMKRHGCHPLPPLRLFQDRFPPFRHTAIVILVHVTANEIFRKQD
ncbi:hypothetical protein ACRQ1B_07820 [Rhizobium panacihumi]